ncbi:hypothetical protein D3C72_1138410 [compost metagenome]
MVTIRCISSRIGLSIGSSIALLKPETRCCTIAISSSIEEGTGRITVLKRRFNALDNSLTPLSLLLAVAIRLKPFTACTSVFNSGMGNVFSERMVINVSCTSELIRVNSSTLTILPSFIALITGVSTIASITGPAESNRA